MAPPGPYPFPTSYIEENSSGRLLRASIFLLIIETLFIVLLLVSRYVSKEGKIMSPMVALMTTGYLVCVGKISLVICMIYLGGAGHHLPTLPYSSLRKLFQMMLVLQLFCPLATSFTKLGILVLLHKILASTSRRYSVLIRITFVIVLLTMVTQFIIPLVNCAPFSYNWDRRLPGGTCRIPGLMLWRWVSMPNMFTTVIMILIPLPSLYKLRISHAEKLGLGLVFIVCLLGVLAAVMRFRAFMMVQNFKDITFEMAAPLCWTLAESGIYLIAGVLPTLKPLVKKMVGEEWLERRRMREDESFGYKGSGSGSGNGYKDESRNGSGATEEIALSGIGRSLEFKVSVEDYDEMRTATGGSGGEGDERGLVGKRRA